MYTKADIEQGLKQAVADYGPEHVDEGSADMRCLYTYPSGKHCIAGYVLKELGFEPTEKWDQHGPVDELVLELLDPEGTKFELAAADMLQDAQTMQDRGMQWGEVLGKIVP